MGSNQERDDRLELNGIVIGSNKGIFKVQIAENHIVNAKISGKLKLHEIKVIVGDLVTLHVSPYDLSVGRIVHRLKTNS